MRRKLKICFRIFIIILVTAMCIYIGFRTRHSKAIVVTQLDSLVNNSKSGYLLESEENRLVMIDGGNSKDAANLIDTIQQKGGIVDAWFITIPHEDHAGAILEVLENNNIQVNGIYVSLNGKDWYETFENEAEKLFVAEFMDTLNTDTIKDSVHELQFRDEINVDNLNFKILKVKHPEYTENAGNNQSMVIKVSNNFKSMIFLSELGTEYQEDFINDNQDEIKADSVQVSYHGENTADEIIYKAIRPKISFWNMKEPNMKMLENCLENYMPGYGDITVEIW